MEAILKRKVFGVVEKVKNYRLKSRFWLEIGEIFFFQKMRGCETGADFFRVQPKYAFMLVRVKLKKNKSLREKNTKLMFEISI